MKGLKWLVLSLSVMAVIFIVGFGIGSRTADADEDAVTEAVITITLPQAKVLSNELDEDSQEISRKMVDSEQLKDYRVVIKEAGLQAAEEAGIYGLAEEHMEEILIDLFSEFEGYEVIFA